MKRSASLLSLLFFSLSFAPSHATDLSDRRRHPFSFTPRGAEEVISADLPLSRPLLSPRGTLRSAAVAIRARQCKPMTDRPADRLAVSLRLASPCHAAPAPALGASGYICNPRILSSFPAVSSCRPSMYAEKKRLALSADCQTIFTATCRLHL